MSGQSQVRIILTAILLAPASVFNHCLVLSYNDVGLFQFDLIEFFKMYKGYSSIELFVLDINCKGTRVPLKIR